MLELLFMVMVLAEEAVKLAVEPFVSALAILKLLVVVTVADEAVVNA